MQTFSKDERLCSKVIIDQLIQKGNSFNCFPFKVIWLEIEQSSSSVKIVISVPKRKFKKAVDRNRIKRLTREVYRKKKQVLIEQLGNKKVALLLVYTSKMIFEYTEAEEKINHLLNRLGNEINPLK